MRENKEYKSLSEQEEYDLAVKSAAAMLSRRPLSEAQLLKKLNDKQYSDSAAEYALARMKYLGAIDDKSFGQMIIRSYRAKGCGVLRIKQELAVRGVPKMLCDELLEDFTPDYDCMTAMLDKRLGGDISDRKANDKACAVLQRRGFLFSEIREAMEIYRQSIEQN